MSFFLSLGLLFNFGSALLFVTGKILVLQRKPFAFELFSVWHMQGSSHLAQKHSSDIKPMSEPSEAEKSVKTY